LKKILSSILVLGFLFSTTLPAFGQEPLSITYLYGSSSTGYLTQLEPLQDTLNNVMPDYFNIDNNGQLSVSVSRNFVETAQAKGFKVIPFVSNHFDKSAGHQALLNQDKIVTTITTAVKDYDLDGINLDLENIPIEDKELFNKFVKKLAAEMHQMDKVLSIALPATQSYPGIGWVKAYDYKVLAELVDYIIVMTYDQHWESPGPIAGMTWVEKVVKTVLQTVPAEKLVLGLPFYGRWWINGERYKEVGHQGALTVAAEYLAETKWDDTSQSPYLSFQDAEGNYHQLWFENSHSLGSKLELVNKYNLAGAASWRLGLEDSEFWNSYRRFLRSLGSEDRDQPADRGEQRPDTPEQGNPPDDSGSSQDGGTNNPPPENSDTDASGNTKASDVFSDVSTHWAAADINYLYQEKLVGGYDDGTFKPNASITRAEATAMLMRWLRLPAGQESNFTDVDSTYWAYNAINTAATMGIVGGYDDNTFRPRASISRAELTALLSRVFSGQGSPGQGFTDVEPSHWAYENIINMQGQSLISGYDDGTFRPQSPVTRAEFSTMLARTMRKNS